MIDGIDAGIGAVVAKPLAAQVSRGDVEGDGEAYKQISAPKQEQNGRQHNKQAEKFGVPAAEVLRGREAEELWVIN